MPNILLVDAKWDIITEYLYAFRQHILNRALRNHSTEYLTGRRAIYPIVDRSVRSKHFDYISGAGHGWYHVFKGHRDSVIWRIDMDLSLLRGTIVHLLSCRTGKTLGRKIVSQGGRAFWGYTESFKFLHKNPPPADLHTDSTAEVAIKMDCTIDLGILEGLRAAEIYRNVQDHVKLNSGGPHNSFQRAVLRHNFNHLVCPATYGDLNATL